MSNKSKKSKKGVSKGLTFTLCLLILLIGAAGTYVLSIKTKYSSKATYTNQENLKQLDGGIEQTIASLFVSKEQIEAAKQEVTYSGIYNATTSQDDSVIEIQHISGDTYQGKMMIVKDPSLVTIAVNPNLDSSGEGLTLEEYIEQENGIGGTNAGGFQDSGGHGNGGQAWGIVIKDGKLISGSLSDYTAVIGINYNNELVCQYMTAQQAIDWEVKEGITFGPILVNDFQDVFASGGQAQLNPRTVIGQRADGAFLILVLEGRQPQSFGAKYQDLVDIMLSYGARTAACLDGGNSSLMMYEGETIASPVAIWGSRNLPTAIVVKGEN